MSDAVIKVQRHMETLYNEHTRSLTQQHCADTEWLHAQFNDLHERLGFPYNVICSTTRDVKKSTTDSTHFFSRKRKLHETISSAKITQMDVMHDTITQVDDMHDDITKIDVMHDEITQVVCNNTETAEKTIPSDEITNQDTLSVKITETAINSSKSSAFDSKADVNVPVLVPEAPSHQHRVRVKLEPSKWKVVDIRKELKKKGLPLKGLKAVLLNRLEEALNKEAEVSADPMDTKNAADSEGNIPDIGRDANAVEIASDPQIERPNSTENKNVGESECHHDHDVIRVRDSMNEMDDRTLAVKSEESRDFSPQRSESTPVIIEGDATIDSIAEAREEHQILPAQTAPICVMDELVRESDPGTESKANESEPESQPQEIDNEPVMEPKGPDTEGTQIVIDGVQLPMDTSRPTMKALEEEPRELIALSDDMTSDDEDSKATCIRSDPDENQIDSEEKHIPQEADEQEDETTPISEVEHVDQTDSIPKPTERSLNKVVSDADAKTASDRSETSFQKETPAKAVKDDVMSEPKTNISHPEAIVSRKVMSEQVKSTHARKESEDRKTSERRFNIEREVLRIRMAAKKSAQQRYEQAKANKHQIPSEQAPEKESVAALSVSKSEANQKETIPSTSQSIEIHSPMRDADAHPANLTSSAIHVDCISAKVAITSAPTISQIQKPSNLVSTLHSFTSLLESKQTKIKETRKSFKQNSMHRSIPVVSALKKAEKLRELEQQRKVEKIKRLQALRKKHEQERAVEDARKERKLQLNKERTSRKTGPKRVVNALEQAKRRHEKMQGRSDLSKNGLLASSTALFIGEEQPKESTTRVSQGSADASVHRTQSDKKQSIPVWARKENLERIMHIQYQTNAIDPSPQIFPDFVDTCDLEKIFDDADARKKKQFSKRNSSGNWMADRPNAREKALYRREMGFRP
uniref:Uncharacterized protein AlNc14C394G11312 n=1 Tax=Albugo laibachii Nc14 TaxID=890382 RepID=F0WYP9_9STRA|nr:conserved hypothetical protein [Albugo laibachii Nc14]|eukprot:CCA26608.1 conserved hypothetical protein [Albugo laibachii Nc14]